MAPSFLRTLLYPNVDNLQLPTTFVSKHMSNQFPKEIKIQSANGRCTWRLKIHKNGENYFFGNGWKNVVEDAHLGILDSMTFELVDKSTFKMVTYTQDGCQKDFPTKAHLRDNVDVLGGPVAICRGQSPLPSGPVAICPGQSPLPRGPVATPTLTFNVAWPLNDLNDDVVGDDDDVDYEVTFDKILAQSHYERLPLPAEFVKLAKIESDRTIMLKNHAGKEWSVGIRSATSSGFRTYRLLSGWTEFWRMNRLSVGDICVLKYIRSEDKLCVFKATK